MRWNLHEFCWLDDLQCLRNKEYGSIAKYCRERYLDAVERNAPDMELRQIIEAMRVDATKELDTVIPGPSPALLFEDHSATQLIRGPDGSMFFICVNYLHNIEGDS